MLELAPAGLQELFSTRVVDVQQFADNIWLVKTAWGRQSVVVRCPRCGRLGRLTVRKWRITGPVLRVVHGFTPRRRVRCASRRLAERAIAEGGARSLRRRGARHREEPREWDEVLGREAELRQHQHRRLLPEVWRARENSQVGQEEAQDLLLLPAQAVHRPARRTARRVSHRAVSSRFRARPRDLVRGAEDNRGVEGAEVLVRFSGETDKDFSEQLCSNATERVGRKLT